MTSTHTLPKKITAVFALIFLVPPVYIFAIWSKVFSQDITQAQKISSFSDHFPAFLRDYKIILYFSIACCILL